ncbi:hypothetical protein H5410_062613, partial [Solanum commersonii]
IPSPVAVDHLTLCCGILAKLDLDFSLVSVSFSALLPFHLFLLLTSLVIAEFSGTMMLTCGALVAAFRHFQLVNKRFLQVHSPEPCTPKLPSPYC